MNLKTSFAIAGVATLFAGCAVMTVDVDVYKGPLANHDEVQVQQLTVMANSAKPLLTSLRNTLEKTTGHRDPTRLPKYKDGFMPKPSNDPENKNWFKNPQARQVNAVLSLYEDMPAPPAFARLLDQAQVQLDIYQKHWRVLHPKTGDDVHSVNLKLAQQLQQLQIPSKTEENVRDGFVRFLQSNTNRSPDIILDPATSFPSTHEGSVPPTKEWANYSTNAKMLWLEDREFVRELIRHVIPSPKKSQELVLEEVVTKVTDIATAFRRCREALSQLYLIALDAAEISDHEMITGGDKDRLRKIAEFIAEITNAQRLSAAFEQKAIAAEIAPVAPLLGRGMESVRQKLSKSHPGIGFSEIKTVQAALTTAIVQQPSTVIPALRRAHLSLQGGFVPTDQFKAAAGNKANILLISETLYGLPAGPIHQLDAMSPANLEAFSHIIFEGAEGLERGRSPHGLDTLLERYLKALHDGRSADADRIFDEGQRELVYFAQKVLFLGNNIKLVPTSGTTNTVDPLIYLLQAVGNSITTQMDEAHHRHAFQSQSTNISFYADSYGSQRPGDPLQIVHGRIDSSAHRFETEFSSALADAAKKTKENKDAQQRAEQILEQKTQAHRKIEEEIASLQEGTNTLNELVQRANSADFGNQPANTTAAHLLQVLRERENQERVDDFVNATRRITMIQSILAQAPTNSMSRDRAKSALVNFLLDQYGAYATTLGNRQRDATIADQAKTAAQTTAGEAAEEFKSAAAAEVKLRSEKSIAQKVVSELEGRAAQLVPKLRALGEQVTPSSGIILLHDELITAANNETDANKQAVLQRALTEVKSWGLPGRGNTPRPPTTATTRAEVWTELIVQLEFERVNALRDGQHSTAAAIQNAIDAAQESRAGLAYLRPTSSYLRTSFPVSAFQDNRVAWKNMLSQHARRQLPGATGFPENRPKNINALQQIDNQFWHNVNRVRVAGGGDSNYVLAKDDVGNWYIKEYSVDVKEVVNSMQKLALFGAGPALGAPGAFQFATSTNTEPGLNQSAYRAQYDLFTTNYLNETKALYLDAKTNLTPAKIKQKILTAWNNAADQTASDALDNAGQALVELPNYPNSPSEAADQLVKLTRGLRDCYLSLTNGLPAATHSTQLTAAQKTLGALSQDVMARRQETLRNYEAALKVIGMSAGKN